MPYFIQFPHPQGEPDYNHSPKGQITWSTTKISHTRKFIQAKGEYIDPSSNKIKSNDKVSFWGEWEANSSFEKFTKKQTTGYPIAKHTISNIDNKQPPFKAHNTDPYVFDRSFFYSNCKQKTKQNSTSVLRNLDQGSIILFGSRINFKFCIDTVFVVKNIHHLTISNGKGEFDPEIKLSKRYIKSVIKPIIPSAPLPLDFKKTHYTVYTGATIEDPLVINNQKIFSYIPCSIPTSHPNGFKRPEIQHEVITDKLSQGFKKEILKNSAILEVWNNVKNQILNKGLKLGTAIY